MACYIICTCPDARERAGPVFPPPPGEEETQASRASGQYMYYGGLVSISHYQIEERTVDQSPDDSDIAKKLFYADDGTGGGTLDQVTDKY